MLLPKAAVKIKKSSRLEEPGTVFRTAILVKS